MWSWHCRWFIEPPGLLGRIPSLRLSSVHALLPSCSLNGHKAVKMKLCPKTEQKHHFVQANRKRNCGIVPFYQWWVLFGLWFCSEKKDILFFGFSEGGESEPYTPGMFRKELFAGFVHTDTESSLPLGSGVFSLPLGSSFRQTPAWAMGFSRPYFSG